MAVSTTKILRGNKGGHSGFVTATIDERELKSLIKDLESLNMSESKNKTILRQGMRKASKPILQELKDLVPKKSGQLRKSLGIGGVQQAGNSFDVTGGSQAITGGSQTQSGLDLGTPISA